MSGIETLALAAGLSATAASAASVAVPLAIAAGGAAITAKSAIDAGNAERETAEFNAAQIEETARQERESAGLRAQERRRITDQGISTQRALLASDGADTTAGQPLMLQEDLAAEGEFQAGLEQFQGDRSADAQQQRADQQRRTGKSRQRAGFTRARTSFLSSAAQAYASFG